MTTEPTPPAGPPFDRLDPLAGLLSYLVPGLGQITQQRYAKGVLFLVCLYALFGYGLALGGGRNVYLPDTVAVRDGLPRDPRVPREPAVGSLERLGDDLYARPHFAGQFFIGVAAWPAVYQYRTFDPETDEGPIFGKFMRTPPGPVLNQLQRDASKTWDLGWVYTVIAGVLNILVICDAVAGPAMRPPPEKDEKSKKDDEKPTEPKPEEKKA